MANSIAFNDDQLDADLATILGCWVTPSTKASQPQAATVVEIPDVAPGGAATTTGSRDLMLTSVNGDAEMPFARFTFLHGSGQATATITISIAIALLGAVTLLLKGEPLRDRRGAVTRFGQPQQERASSKLHLRGGLKGMSSHADNGAGSVPQRSAAFASEGTHQISSLTKSDARERASERSSGPPDTYISSTPPKTPRGDGDRTGFTAPSPALPLSYAVLEPDAEVTPSNTTFVPTVPPAEISVRELRRDSVDAMRALRRQ